MLRLIRAHTESWPLKAPFRIARGVKTHAHVVVVEIAQGAVVGRGECAPTPHYGESVESVLAQVASVEALVAGGAGRDDLQAALPPGSARSAIDCALWDLELRLGGDALAAFEEPRPITTALTIGIGTAEEMGAAAQAMRGARLVKVKLDGEAIEARLRAVRAALPDCRLIVDANEGWTREQLVDCQPLLAQMRVEFVEQPLPAGRDGELAGLDLAVPLCADESCHTRADLPRLVGSYRYVNIKLDKTGGLTEALALEAEARRLGLGVMVGCMVGTSLSMAPAFQVAMRADYADLDAPWLLLEDRPEGLTITAEGQAIPPRRGFWGPGDEGAVAITSMRKREAHGFPTPGPIG